MPEMDLLYSLAIVVLFRTNLVGYSSTEEFFNKKFSDQLALFWVQIRCRFDFGFLIRFNIQALMEIIFRIIYK